MPAHVVLAAHRTAWDAARLAADAPERALLAEADPLRRIGLALGAPLPPADAGAVIADAFASLARPARLVTAALLFPRLADRTDLPATTLEAIASDYALVGRAGVESVTVRRGGRDWKRELLGSRLAELDPKRPRDAVLLNVAAALMADEEAFTFDALARRLGRSPSGARSRPVAAEEAVTRELHNMSVPSTSTIAVRRARLAGRRFRVDLESGVPRGRARRAEPAARDDGLASGAGHPRGRGRRAAADDTGSRARARRSSATSRRRSRRPECPARVGVFLDEPDDPSLPLLGAAAALAVLARRSGPLYLPNRRLEPSLVRLTSTVLFFPEETPMSQTEADALVRRVLDVVPARTHAMAALLQLFRVEATAAVPTASVSLRAAARPARQPPLRRRALPHRRAPLHARDARAPPRAARPHAPLPALDARAQPRLRRGDQRAPVRALPAGGLHLLLHGHLRRRAWAPAPAGAARPAAPARPASLAALHRALYDGTATAEEVFRAIVREVRLTFGVGELLGSHGEDEEWGTEGPADPAVVDAIRRIVEKWPPPETPVRGRSLSDLLRDATVEDGARPSTPRSSRRCGGRSATRRSRTEGCASAVRGRCRPSSRCPTRATGAPASRASLGATPLLYASTLTDRRARQEIATHVYLDVSGSVEPWLEDLYGALVALRRHLAPAVHLFSTRVETVPLDALREGVRKTTLGTDIACVLDHALARPARRVLVVTDGYVGQPDAAAAEAARRARSTCACCSHPEAGGATSSRSPPDSKSCRRPPAPRRRTS